MKWWHKLIAVVHKRPLDDELREELESHLEMLTEDNVAAGMEPAEARRAARLALGNPAVVAELHRDARGLPSLESLLQDLRYAFRTLRRDYAFTLIAVLILGIGLGANAVVFGLVDALLLQPLPFAEPDRLVWVENGKPGATNPSALASRVVSLRGWREGSRQLMDLAAYSPFFTRDSWALTGDGVEPERLKGVRVTDNFLPLLGVPMHLGRSFTPEEVVDGPRAVILSHRLWSRRFESDPGIIGETIDLHDIPWTVVGVTPPQFDFGAVFEPGYDVDLLLPAQLDVMANWGNTLSVVGRLAPGATVQSAAEELALISARMTEEDPQFADWPLYARTSTLREHISAGFSGSLWMLWGAVAMVLAIVCANLSNLMLVRGVSRRRELAIRAALGAGKRRLVRQLMTESLVLAGLGVVLGLGLATFGLRAIVGSQMVVMPLLDRAGLDAGVVGFAASLALVVALLIGSVPAMQVARRDPFADLGQASRGARGNRVEHGTRSALVVAEIALACSLLIGAGLLIRSFTNLLDTDLGFEPTRAATVTVNAGNRFADADAVVAFQRQLVEAVRNVAGVEHAGYTDNLPLDGNRSWSIAREEEELGAESENVEAFVRFVSEGFFPAMGIPIVAGRGFTFDDDAETGRVIVINETGAATLWPGEDAVGRGVRLYNGVARVVGVVGDVRHNDVRESSGVEMYLATSQAPVRNLSLVVRTAGDPLALAGQIRAAVAEVDPRVPFTDYRPIGRLVSRALSAQRFFTSMLTGFAGIALVLASLGIYGVISYSVSQRRAEIGIRMALGAMPGRVLRDEIRRGVVLAVAGLSIGLVGALLASRFVSSELYGIGATDPATYAGAALCLLLVAIAAALVPSWRAARTSPVKALRDA